MTLPIGIPPYPAVFDSTYGSDGHGAVEYWVDAAIGNDAVGNGTYANPRRTLPSLSGLAPGTVINLMGGTFTNTTLNIASSGTEAQPIVFRGLSSSNKALIKGKLGFSGSYLIVENLLLDHDGDAENLIALAGTATYTILRDCEMAGNGVNYGSRTIYVITGDAHHNGVFRCKVHDFGDYNEATSQNDFHAFSTGSSAGGHHFWYLWNEVYHMGGDAFGNSHMANNACHDFYIGGNTSYANHENAVDLKEVYNIIISSNTFHTFAPSSDQSGSTDSGEAIVFHGNDGPHGTDNAWAINNLVYGAGIGIGSTSYALNNWMIGNVVYDTGDCISPNRDSALRARCYHNTVYNALRYGIDQSGASLGSLECFGNIVHTAATRHAYFNRTAVTNVGNECYWQSPSANPQIQWGGTTCNGVADWLSRAGGKGAGSIQLDPQFVDAAGHDFRLRSTSPCIGVGYDMRTVNAAFQAAFPEYGSQISLMRDLYGTPRPNGVWDIGAAQYAASAAPIGTPVLSAR